MDTFTVKGTTDDCTTCECCGRTNLRSTVVLMPLDADGNEYGEAVYYGNACAAYALGVSAYRMNRLARSAQITATIERRRELRDRAAWALPLMHRNRADLVHRMSGPDPDAVAAAHANRLGTAVGRYYSERREQVRSEARSAYVSGGLSAILALYDHYTAEATRLSRMDPEVFTY